MSHLLQRRARQELAATFAGRVGARTSARSRQGDHAVPQPKKSGSTARKPAARKPAAARPAARAAEPATASGPLSAEDVSAHLGALRERLISSVTLTTERLQ